MLASAFLHKGYMVYRKELLGFAVPVPGHNGTRTHGGTGRPGWPFCFHLQFYAAMFKTWHAFRNSNQLTLIWTLKVCVLRVGAPSLSLSLVFCFLFFFVDGEVRRNEENVLIVVTTDICLQKTWWRFRRKVLFWFEFFLLLICLFVFYLYYSVETIKIVMARDSWL